MRLIPFCAIGVLLCVPEAHAGEIERKGPAWSPPPHAVADSPSLHRDVIPALTKAGCNSGACHGSFQGRGGFRLSLLGFDPDFDREQMVLSSRGRRVFFASPQESLLFRKATGDVPHGGGRRMAADSEVAVLLERYIAQGAPPANDHVPKLLKLVTEPGRTLLKPGDTLQIVVRAHWSDGQESDVTRWVLYDSRDETLCQVSPAGQITAVGPGKAAVMVRYQGLVDAVDLTIPYEDPQQVADFVPRNFIDHLALEEWRRIGVAPAALAGDQEFVRRVYGDLIGTLPTPEQTRAFVDDDRPDKRERLIDELLSRPEYVDYWSVKWGDLLRVHRRYVGDKGLAAFSGWLRQQLRENRPLSQMVSELLTAQGNLFQSGPVSYFFVDTQPEELAETTAQVFMGVRMQCARCHHHPMEVWAQEDYYGLAAFFTRLEVKQTQELGGQGRYGGIRILRVARAVPENRRLKFDAPAKLPGGAIIPATEQGDVRQQLAAWLVAPDNPWFARNFANRYWSWIFGIGLIEQVDDLRHTNPATMPELLDALAADFAAHNFDAKHLLRTICTSRTYQSASLLSPLRDSDGKLFTHRVPRQLPAEVLLDAVNQVTGATEGFAGLPAGMRAIALPDPTIPSEFLTVFGRPQRNSPCECARASEPNLSQALQLVNSESLQKKLADPNGRVAMLLKSEHSDAEVIQELYYWCYSRPPEPDELRISGEIIQAAPSRQEAVEDLLWSLLNTAEFVFSH